MESTLYFYKFLDKDTGKSYFIRSTNVHMAHNAIARSMKKFNTRFEQEKITQDDREFLLKRNCD